MPRIKQFDGESTANRDWDFILFQGNKGRDIKQNKNIRPIRKSSFNLNLKHQINYPNWDSRPQIVGVVSSSKEQRDKEKMRIADNKDIVVEVEAVIINKRAEWANLEH